MPKIRIGLSTDFNLTGEQVGIGTTNPTARLEVAGQILADNTAGSGGISTYREYQGFHQTQSNVSHKVTIDATTAGNLNSLSGELRIDGDVTIAPDTSVTSGKIDSLTATDKFAVPLGETNNRENTPEAGTTRFNQDFGTLEFFDGNNWKTVNSLARGSFAGRAYLAGSARYNNVSGYSTRMDTLSIISGGKATYFGDLVNTNGYMSGCASSTRGVFAPGLNNPSYLEYITLSTGGNAVEFGQMYVHRAAYQGTLSSSTRGIVPGGYTPAVYRNDIDYFEIATTGGAQDFGDISVASFGQGGMASPVRGVWAGGYQNPGTTGLKKKIQYITISSKGDSTDFGEAFSGHAYAFAGSSSTIGIFGGGVGSYPNPQQVTSVLEKIQLASTGNGFYFGDLTTGRRLGGSSASNTRLACFGGTNSIPGANDDSDTIDTIQFSTLGNAVDFGDMSDTNLGLGGCSDCHGGLGGF